VVKLWSIGLGLGERFFPLGVRYWANWSENPAPGGQIRPRNCKRAFGKSGGSESVSTKAVTVRKGCAP
jgi:hypothetical protein